MTTLTTDLIAQIDAAAAAIAPLAALPRAGGLFASTQDNAAAIINRAAYDGAVRAFGAIVAGTLYGHPDDAGWSTTNDRVLDAGAAMLDLMPEWSATPDDRKHVILEAAAVGVKA